MLLNETCNCVQLHSAEAPGTLQGNGFQPEFCHHHLAPHVDVGRLAPIQGYEEETIGTYPENRCYAIAVLWRQVEISTGRRQVRQAPRLKRRWCAERCGDWLR